MRTATDDAQTSRDDPSLAPLVPRRSRGRNLLLGGLGIVALVAAWFSPELLRPSVVSEDPSGTWSAILTHNQVLAVVQLQPEGLGGVSVRSVSEVPGARVSGSWIVIDGLANFDEQVDAADFATGESYLEAAFGPGILTSGSALPRDVDDDRTTHLVILWDITQCAQLDADKLPEVELRSWLRTTTHQKLGTLATPAYDVPTLTETGICPT